MTKRNNQVIACLAPLLESGQAGLEADALAGDCIAAATRASIWAVDRKSDKPNRLTEEDWMQFLEFYEEATDECLNAVQRFSKEGDQRKLADALAKVAPMLNRRPDSWRAD